MNHIYRIEIPSKHVAGCILLQWIGFNGELVNSRAEASPCSEEESLQVMERIDIPCVCYREEAPGAADKALAAAAQPLPSPQARRLHRLEVLQASVLQCAAEAMELGILAAESGDAGLATWLQDYEQKLLEIAGDDEGSTGLTLMIEEIKANQ